MLTELHIENIAVIEAADIEFRAGLNVLTGETGAGKSIVIDAIDAVLGGRTSRELVRTGADKALVRAVFTGDAAAAWCEENDIEHEDALILSRRITAADGKSVCRVNGAPVSVSQLRELGALLLDMHGQNDGRQLMDERRHLEYLDRFGKTSPQLAAFTTAFEAYRRVCAQIEELSMDQAEKERLTAVLESEIAELKAANLRPGEEAELTERRDLLKNAGKLTELLDEAYSLLYSDESAAVSAAGDAAQLIEKAAAYYPQLEKAAGAARDAAFMLEDAAEQLRDVRRGLDFSPEDFDRLESRLSQLRRLSRKYGRDEAGLLAFLQEKEDKLASIAYSDDLLLKLQKEQRVLLEAARAAAAALTEARREAADKLSARIQGELADLSMPSVRFAARLSPLGGEPGFDRQGAERAKFLISANAGEELGPISRIASGGELSRIMLAMKNVFAAGDAVPTMVFDEIDAGVSGVAAQRVAEKLASLSRRKQVLCITHLPQIAAMADTQFEIAKTERDGRTYTSVRALDLEGRKQEIARLFGGDNITINTLAGAAEQLAAAGEFKAQVKGERTK